MSAVESWFAPAAVAAPSPAKRQPRRRPAEEPVTRKPKTRSQGRHALRVRSSLVWMALFALLLVGVVAVNVAVLRANVSVNDLNAKIAQVQATNANLASQYSSSTAAPRVEAAARVAGDVPATSEDSSLVDMGSGK